MKTSRPLVDALAAAPTDDGDRRETILLAAERCFARWGVLRTRMEDIAREARIARPALYRYFAGKETILLAVLVRHIDDRARALHDTLRLKGPAAPLILKALLTGIRNSPDPSLIGAILEVDILHETARLVGQSDAVFDAMSGYWRPYLEYARDRGELRAGVELDEAVRWLTLIVFYFLTVPEIVPPDQKLSAYLKTFVVNALVIE